MTSRRAASSLSASATPPRRSVSRSRATARSSATTSISTAGENLKDVVPKVNLVYVKDYAIAFGALKDGSVDAFPTDETVLRAIVQQDGRPEDYLFLPDFAKSRNVGFALKKGEPRFKDAINRALHDIEASGEAVKIFESWFGPGSEMPMKRAFKKIGRASCR